MSQWERQDLSVQGSDSLYNNQHGAVWAGKRGGSTTGFYFSLLSTPFDQLSVILKRHWGGS